VDPGIPTVLGLALLPALGNFAGDLLAEWLRPSRAILNRALHAAAGIILAVIANFRARGLGKARRLALSAAFAAPVIGAAAFAFFILRGRSEAAKMAALVFVAGLYMLAAVEDMLHETHESAEDTRWSAISFLAGFALFLVMAGGVR
jgi:ZIP family zinc transporter